MTGADWFKVFLGALALIPVFIGARLLAWINEGTPGAPRTYLMWVYRVGWSAIVVFVVWKWIGA